jgi:pimeloyl-ACP methyl ester carboxylesterase
MPRPSGDCAVEEWVKLRGSKILVRRHGEGEPVLLLNGIGSHTGMWRPIEGCWPDRQVISFDAPGVGRSRNRLVPPTIREIAEVAVAVLDHFGLDQVDVVGYSLGGTVAQALAWRHPQRVRRLVLAATSFGYGLVPGQWRSVIHLYNPLRYYSKLYYEWTIGPMAGGQALTDPMFIERHGELRRQHRPNLMGYYMQMAAISSYSTLCRLKDIEVPTLVVTGDDDRLIPPVNSFMLARRIPGARLLVSPGDGHLLLFDSESPVLALILEFLDATTPADSQAWREALDVTEEDEAAALSATVNGSFPYNLYHAGYRRLVDRFQGPRSSAP